MPNKIPSEDTSPGFASRVPALKPGKYSDGTPLHEVQFLECKIILKPELFTTAKSFVDYAKVVNQAATETEVDCTNEEAKPRPEIREVLFMDTADSRLYKNAFILRQRIQYEDGFPVGDPEIVFKFRHPDMQKAAEMDVRPRIGGDYRVKFKVEALPLKDRLGSYRLLFSHNVQFSLSEAPGGDRTATKVLTRALPALASVLKTDADRVELVNQTIVEEVLQDLGTLDFGKGMEAKFNVSLWRERGMHRPLSGEFAFQLKFKTVDELHEKALARAARLFVALQQIGRKYVLLGATKTGIVYALKGNPPQAHD